MTDDLVTFLRARLDEDEAHVTAAMSTTALSGDRYGEGPHGNLNCVGRHGHGGCGWNRDVSATPDDERRALGHEHSLTHATADDLRQFREVEAKRRIIELHDTDHECSTIRTWTDWDGIEQVDIDRCTWVADEPCSTLQLLALPDADHPDYRDEWKP